MDTDELRKKYLPDLVDRDILITDRARYTMAQQLVGELLIELGFYRKLGKLLGEVRASSETGESVRKTILDEIDEAFAAIQSLGEPKKGDEDDGKPLFPTLVRRGGRNRNGGDAGPPAAEKP